MAEIQRNKQPAAGSDASETSPDSLDDGTKQSTGGAREATSSTDEPHPESTETAEIKPKPSIWKRFVAKSGLDLPTMMVMAKGACAPVVGLALFQYPPFAARFPTIGYLVAIAATLSMSFMPRAKFIQTMTINILGICIGACVALLTCYCSVQARIHTSDPIQSKTPGASGAKQATEYNSSASAVSGIWLFFNIMFANALRFSRPQLQTPVILYSIFANISGTFAPLFATMTQSIAFVEMIFEAFLSGFGIAIVVNFVVFPISSRRVVCGQFTSYVKLTQAAFMKQRAFLQTLEHIDMLEVPGEKGKSKQSDKNGKSNKATIAASSLKESLLALTGLHAKIKADIPFAKREVTIGKLDAKNLDEIMAHFRSILLPLLGLASVADIFMRIADVYGWNEPEGEGHPEKREPQYAMEQVEWNEIMQALHQPFQDVCAAMNDGLNHALYVLELEKRPKSNKAPPTDPEDVEASAVRKPGDPQYTTYLEAKLGEFKDCGKGALHTWCHQRGINLEDVTTSSMSESILESSSMGINRRRLYLILYVEFLLASIAASVLAFAKYADSKVECGTMKKKRLITPGKRRVWKWLRNILAVEDVSNELNPDSAETGGLSFALGDAFHERKDPEHLAPSNIVEKIGDRFRKTTDVFRKMEVAFGFRVACATMSIAIIAYLEPTQMFFVEQRLVWAMIMVAIGMTMTSGAGAFGFLARVFGTFCAMCTSLIIWYIAGGRGIPGAALPILWVFCFFEMWILVKKPRFIVVGIIVIVTQILILGYELQADTVGIAIVTSNHQVYYPIYELAPYRLASVAAGCAVAFIWTYFPYPLTARTALRMQLGEVIYLLANYYSCVHTTVRMRLDESGGDPKNKETPAGKLEKARIKVLSKILGMLSQLRLHSDMVSFEFNVGGKFPKETYMSMITKTQHLVDYIALLDYSTRAWDVHHPDHTDSKWFHDLKTLSNGLHISSQEIVGLLTLISSSLCNSSPLPPYLTAPKPYKLTEQIVERNKGIVSLRNVLEKGYSAFAVTQVATRLIDDDLDVLLRHTKALVGEVDFSFHVVSTSSEPQDNNIKGKID